MVFVKCGVCAKVAVPWGGGFLLGVGCGGGERMEFRETEGWAERFRRTMGGDANCLF